MFPYAYYKEYFDGPMHGHSFKGKALYIEPVETYITSGGVIDVSKMTHFPVDTTSGDVVVEGFRNGEHGQVLLVHKIATANTLTFKSEDASAPGKIFTSNRQDLTFGAGQFGGTILICLNNGGVLEWRELDSNGLLSNGTEAQPSLAFSSDPDTGIFRISEDQMGIVTGGETRLRVTSSAVLSKVQHRFESGNVSAPGIGFNSGSNTGIYYDSGEIHFSLQSLDCLSVERAAVRVPRLLQADRIMTSNDEADSALIPANGIYSKGSIRTSGQFEGTATSALYADLAERYEADKEYPVGTVVILGGEKEITVTGTPGDESILGVVSTEPAFKMNDKPGGDPRLNPFIALTGRVPCRVIGQVKKGDRLVSSSNEGVASSMGEQSNMAKPFAVVGRALESKSTTEVELIEIVVGRL